MDLTAKMNNEGFRKKLNNLKNLDMMFKSLPGHVAHFLRDEVVDSELNFNPIGRISGILAGSVTVEQRPYYGSFTINGNTQAPYAPYVSNWMKKNYGFTPKESVLRRAVPVVMQTVDNEWRHAVDIIERGGSYVYDNPFYQSTF